MMADGEARAWPTSLPRLIGASLLVYGALALFPVLAIGAGFGSYLAYQAAGGGVTGGLVTAASALASGYILRAGLRAVRALVWRFWPPLPLPGDIWGFGPPAPPRPGRSWTPVRQFWLRMRYAHEAR